MNENNRTSFEQAFYEQHKGQGQMPEDEQRPESETSANTAIIGGIVLGVLLFLALVGMYVSGGGL